MWMHPRLARSLGSRSARALAACALTASCVHSVLTRPASCDAKSKPPALSPQAFRAFPVRRVEELTHNTKRITLALPHADDQMGLTTASCVLVRAMVDGKAVVRPYTPTNLNDERGRVELVVKAYPQGKLSRHLGQVKVGDHVEVKGPMLKFKYEPNQYQHIGMLAGGTGLTPMLQLVRTICRNPDDKTRISLLCANVTEDDMLLKEELKQLQDEYPQLNVYHVLSAPSDKWQGLRGIISSRLVFELMPNPDDPEILVCVCGPPGMMEHVCGDKAPDHSQGELKGVLERLGYKSHQVFKF